MARFRRPSLAERIAIAALTVYAAAVIALDTARPFLLAPPDAGAGWPRRWYPIADLGFEADNDGRITSVDPGGSAWQAGLRAGQHQVIAIGSMRPDRRPINKFLFVAHGSAYRFRVQQDAGPPFEAVVRAKDETFAPSDTLTLLIAQAGGFFFVGLCAFLVWRHASWATWGLFLYSLWFNSGQYFVWYANLSAPALVGFDALQVLSEAAGLAGFLSFALHFPMEDVQGWRRAIRVPLLGGAAAVLFGFEAWAFMNFVAGWRTEAAYRVYYGLRLGAYALASWLFWHTYRTRPADRARVRWIALAGIWGLFWYLLADMYESTSMLDWLAAVPARTLAPWLARHLGLTTTACLNVLYTQSVALPLAVVYTALRHRIMSVRFAVTRAAVSFALFTVLMLGFHSVIEHVSELSVLEPVAVASSFLLSVASIWMHGPLHTVAERVLFARWHRARQRLEALAARLIDDDLERGEVDEALVRDTAEALSLRGAALYRRQSDGTFTREAAYGWPAGSMPSLAADDPLVASLGTAPRRVEDDPRDTPEPGLDGFAPVLVCPIVIHRAVSRLLVLAAHDSDEAIDPDEVRVIAELSRAAAVAYRRLDAEAAQTARQ